MNNSKICQYLSWDSEFFGIDIGRVTKHRLDEPSLFDIKKWCKSFNINCLYFLADSNHSNTIRLAGGFGFQLVDMPVYRGLGCIQFKCQFLNEPDLVPPFQKTVDEQSEGDAVPDIFSRLLCGV